MPNRTSFLRCLILLWGFTFGVAHVRGQQIVYAPSVWWDQLDAPLPRTIELDLFSQWTWFDNNAGRANASPKDRIGYGGRLGVFLSDPHWEIEGDGYYSPQDNGRRTALNASIVPSKVNASAFALRLTYNVIIGGAPPHLSQFILGIGGVRTSYNYSGAGSGASNADFGVSGLVGLRVGIANRIALRTDAVADYMPNRQPTANLNLHVRAGVSFLLRGVRPEVMCTYAGLESIPASTPNCVAPPPPPPPPPPPLPPTCQYNPNILATDPACVPPEPIEVGRSPSDSITPIRVFYATDRMRRPGTEVLYGELRGPMQYGVLTVTIPPNHETGKLEGAEWTHFEFKADPRNHIFLQLVTPLPRGTMLTRLAQAVQRADRHEVFVFIHGFNTTFEDAARRTAQLAFDLHLLAVPVMYTWPSAARPDPLAYAADEQAVERTAPQLRQFLEDIVRASGATKIHVLAHSMGSRPLSRAIERMTTADRKIFDNVVLAAPDIDADVFKEQIVPAMRRAARHVTIYASENDEGLRMSNKLHRSKRLGQATPSVSVIPDFDTIDATALAGDWMGHSYYAANSKAIDDLFMTIMLATAPNNRRLSSVGSGAHRYWILK